MLRRVLITLAVFAIGYGFGQAFGPPRAAAGSVDEIVQEFRATRTAIERIHYHMEQRELRCD